MKPVISLTSSALTIDASLMLSSFFILSKEAFLSPATKHSVNVFSVLKSKLFDEVIFNLVNFMTYVGEPSRVDRERMGWYAILFFVVFTALSYLLFREYQKDYH